jgi:hypothetical protein
MQTAIAFDDEMHVLENVSRGKILLVDEDAGALEACSSSLRRQGHEVRACLSLPEDLSSLESEHFDLIAVKFGQIPNPEGDQFWSVTSNSSAIGPSCSWNAASVGRLTWMWRSWESATS